MAFPASVQTQADGLSETRRTAITLKSFSENARDFMAANTVSGNQIKQVMTEFKSAIGVWNAAATISGIGAYAQDQYEDPTLDLPAEFTAMLSAAQNVIDTIIANVPTSAGGFVEIETWGADGSISVRQFTPTQTAALRTQLDTLIAAID